MKLSLLTVAATTVAAEVKLNNGYFISKSTERNAEQACADINGVLATITDENREFLSDLLKGGKYNVAGATKPGKCNFFDRRNNYSINKACRKLKYICDVTATARNLEPECQVDPNTPDLPSGDYHVYVGETEYESYTWHEARDYCKALGKDTGEKWDLVIFNGKSEFDMVNNFLQGKCYSDKAFWIGYRESDGVTTTQYGKTTPWDIPYAQGEPNDSAGIEECVRMRNGEANDARCSRNWTGNRNDDVGMGLICERMPLIDSCQAKEDYEIPEDNRYVISESGSNSWEASRVKCQAIGEGWDLAVIDDFKEHKKLVAMTNCVDYAFWVGFYQNENGDTLDINDNPALYTYTNPEAWDSHSNPSNPEPNDQTGIENCIRLRGDVLNDAKCEISSTGPARSQTGMGYICEFDQSKVTPTPPPQKEPDHVLECGHNVNVQNFTTSAGCPAPYSCEQGPKISIVDSWSKMQNNVKSYGFVANIHLSEEMLKSDWSVLIRFSKLNHKGNFQLWNARFFNFYNGGYEILVTKKWFNADRVDKTSFSFVAENLNSDEYPEVIGFKGKQQQHRCFDKSMSHQLRGGPTAGGAYLQEVASKIAETRPMGARTSGQFDMAKMVSEAMEQISKVRVKKKGGFRVNGSLKNL